MDRRIKKTKTAIKQYIINTYCKSGEQKLSISQLCTAIDINRSTFYLHYQSIDEVIKELEDDALSSIGQIIQKCGFEYMALLKTICDYIKENANLFKTLFNVAGEHFTSLIYKRFYDIVSSSILVKQIEDKTSKDYVITFIIFGTLGVFKKWINENFKTREEDIVLAFLKFLRLDNLILFNN